MRVLQLYETALLGVYYAQTMTTTQATRSLAVPRVSSARIFPKDNIVLLPKTTGPGRRFTEPERRTKETTRRTALWPR